MRSPARKGTGDPHLPITLTAAAPCRPGSRTGGQAPLSWVLGVGKARGHFIDVDSQPGFVVCPHHAAVNLRGPGENLAADIVEAVRLLNAEVWDGEVEMKVRRVPDRRDIPGPVPGGAHTEELAHGSQLAGRSDAADVGEMDPDEVDETVLDQGRYSLMLT